MRTAGGYTLEACGSIQSWKGVVLMETAGEQHVEILAPWAGLGWWAGSEIEMGGGDWSYLLTHWPDYFL